MAKKLRSNATRMKLVIAMVLLCTSRCTRPLSGFFRNATNADIYLEIDYSACTAGSRYQRPAMRVVEGWIVLAGQTLEIEHLFIGFEIRVYRSANRIEELCKEKVDQTFPTRQGKESWKELISGSASGPAYLYFVIKESGISCIKNPKAVK